MNSNPRLMPADFLGTLSVRRFPAASAMPIGIQSRTDLPVVSNRAFVAAWVVRRNRLAAAARASRVR